MLQIGPIRCSAGFLIVMALFALFSQGDSWLWCMAACGAHEAGHCLVLYLLGGKVKTFTLTAIGGEFTLKNPERQSYGAEFLVVLAGPLCNFLWAGIFLLLPWPGRYLAAGFQLTIGVFNFLPVYPLDGGRLLKLVLEWLFPALDAQAVCCTLSLVLCLGLLVGGISILEYSGNNFTLLLVAVWLLADFIQRKRVANRTGNR